MPHECTIWRWYTNTDLLDRFEGYLQGTVFHQNYLLPDKQKSLCDDILRLTEMTSGEIDLSTVLFHWFARIRVELLKTHKDTYELLKSVKDVQDVQAAHGFPDIETCVAWIICFACLRALLHPRSKRCIKYVIK